MNECVNKIVIPDGLKNTQFSDTFLSPRALYVALAIAPVLEIDYRVGIADFPTEWARARLKITKVLSETTTDIVVSKTEVLDILYRIATVNYSVLHPESVDTAPYAWNRNLLVPAVNSILDAAKLDDQDRFMDALPDFDLGVFTSGVGMTVLKGYHSEIVGLMSGSNDMVRLCRTITEEFYASLLESVPIMEIESNHQMHENVVSESMGIIKYAVSTMLLTIESMGKMEFFTESASRHILLFMVTQLVGSKNARAFLETIIPKEKVEVLEVSPLKIAFDI